MTRSRPQPSEETQTGSPETPQLAATPQRVAAARFAPSYVTAPQLASQASATCMRRSHTITAHTADG
jgi:hypothetical protein